VYGQPWPDTLTIATPHAGLHLYFRIPPGTAVASTISRWPGIDIRASGYRSGGYLAGPGSVVGGAEYVIEHDVPAAPLPPLAGQPAHQPGAGSVTPAPTSGPPPRRRMQWPPPGPVGETASCEASPKRGGGNNGPASTAMASSFLNSPGVRCSTGWSLAWPERVVGVAGPLAGLAALVSLGLPCVPGPLQLRG